MKVLIASSEVVPFAKTGGLADVCGALAKELSKLGAEVSLCLPLYRSVLEGNFEIEPILEDLLIELGHYKLTADIYKGHLGNIDVFFVRKDEFYDRTYLYGTPKGDYFDNAQRFIFFSKAVISLSKALNIKWDIIHCNDWQTAIIPVILKIFYADHPLFKDTKTIFTIHNLGYQGVFPKDSFSLTSLPPHLFSIDGLEFWGNMNLLKGGIIFSDLITTVSPTYAKEIQTEGFGFGLDGVLRAHAHKLIGILNGVDYSEWDPERDTYIAANYSRGDISGKSRCKKDLLDEFHLHTGLAERPLIGMITRLATQKGIDLLIDAIDEIIEKEVGLVILGKGEKRYEDALRSISSRFKGKIGIRIDFDNGLAHRIEAGSDMFLIPSLYEPCGLNQMYSLKYGTLPIVYNTGGLADSIIEVDEDKGEGTGFKFYNYSKSGLCEAIDKAIRCFLNKGLWQRLIIQAMSCDFSWGRSAKEYLKIYQMLLSSKSPQ